MPNSPLASSTSKGKGSGGAFSCWAMRRRKKRKRIPDSVTESPSSHLENAINLADQIGPTPNDRFHYFGIPLRTPAEYYRFLDFPFNFNNDFGENDGTFVGRVNVLGIGKMRKRRRKKLEEEIMDGAKKCK